MDAGDGVMLSKASLAVVVMLSMAQEPTLEREYRATRQPGSGLALITLIAIHEDGTPVKGTIQCAGLWQKFQDGQPEHYGPSLPFTVDARGAAIFNPSLDDEWIVCWSAEHGSRGQVTVDFDADQPTAVRTLVLMKES